MNNNLNYRRGDVLLADLGKPTGSVQGGCRPVVIIQNDIGNKYSPTVIVAAVTSQMNKSKLPTHLELRAEEYGLAKDSVVLLEQLRTIDKKRLREKVTHIEGVLMQRVNAALGISLGMN